MEYVIVTLLGALGGLAVLWLATRLLERVTVFEYERGLATATAGSAAWSSLGATGSIGRQR